MILIDEESDWLEYLKEKRDENVYTQEQLNVVLAFYHFFGECPVPQTGPFDNKLMCVHWNRKEHLFTLDIKKDGKFEWFYLNREIDDMEGSEDEDLDIEGVPVLCLALFMKTTLIND